jgi:branched-chain amino acid transport system substrate-binding protein
MSAPRARPRRAWSLGRRAAPCALTALAVGLAGCGGIAAGNANPNASQLTIYSSLPLQGPAAAISQNIVNGEKLALAEVGGRVGSLRVSYVSQDDSSTKTGTWDPGVTAADAKAAAQDKTTIAYLGDYNSGASAISLPLVNAAGILQISPASPYVGLTSAHDAGQDEPDRFYPTGRRTFGRLMPDDEVQGAAQAKMMRGLGVRRLFVVSDENPFEGTLGQIVVADARAAGIRVVASDTVDTKATDYRGEVARVVRSGADAVLFSGGPGPGSVQLWQQLYGADPGLKLLGTSAVADPAFTSQLGPAARNAFMTTPTLAPGLYPPAAQRLFGVYRRTFGTQPRPEMLYGYEAMAVALLAIRRAGANGGDRQSVVDRFFGIRGHDSVLGRYSIQPSGNSTLSDYAVDRVVGGRPVFDRLVRGTAAP